VQLHDKEGVWGTQLMRTSRAAFWDLETARLNYSTTAIRFTARVGAPPSNGQIVWVEGEALKIASVPALVSGTACTYTCNVTRGACGSRGQTHRLDPLGYYAGDNGKEDRLMVDSRPNFGAYRFTGALWLFTLDQFGAVSTYLRRYVYVTEPPQALVGRSWEFKLQDVGALLAEHTPGSQERTVSLSHRLQRSTYWTGGLSTSGQGGGAGVEIPQTAYAYLTRLEAERLFREPLHRVGSEILDSTMTNTLGATLRVTPSEIRYMVDVEASGQWLYQISAVDYNEATRPGESTPTRFARLSLTRIAHQNGNDIYDPGRTDASGFAPGWYSGAGYPVGYGGSDATPPKLTLRVVVDAPPVEALLYLCCSDSAISSDAYDIIVGRVGAGLPSSWFDLGAVQADPLDVDLGTTELLERAQILDEQYSYHLKLDDDRPLAEYLSRDICLLHGLLFGPLQNGLLTLRPWVRPQPASISELRQVIDPGDLVEPGTRLERVRVLELQAGIDFLTLEPRFVRSVRARDVRLRGAKDLGEAVPVRIWQQASAQTLGDQVFQSGALANLIRAWLDVYGGEPVVYEVPTTLDWLVDTGIELGDFLTWVNPDVLTSTGSGVDGTYIVLGYSVQWQAGRVRLRVVEDTFNETYQEEAPSAGSWAAPGLRPTRHPDPIGTGQYRVPVSSLADAGIDLTQAYGGLLADLATAGGYVRVTRPLQGPEPSQYERDGYLEAYATIDAITHDPGTGDAILELTFDAAWERDGWTYNDLLSPESVLTPTDRRPADTSVLATDIEPAAAQLYQSGTGTSPVVKTAGPQAFDKTRHLLGD
jgi:hypothetical protein